MKDFENFTINEQVFEIVRVVKDFENFTINEQRLTELPRPFAGWKAESRSFCIFDISDKNA